MQYRICTVISLGVISSFLQKIKIMEIIHTKFVKTVFRPQIHTVNWSTALHSSMGSCQTCKNQNTIRSIFLS